MTKRLAANNVLTRDGILHDAMVEIRDNTVTAIVPLASLQAEPAATVFLNGTLSGNNNTPLFVGYHGTISTQHPVVTRE